MVARASQIRGIGLVREQLETTGVNCSHFGMLWTDALWNDTPFRSIPRRFSSLIANLRRLIWTDNILHFWVLRKDTLGIPEYYAITLPANGTTFAFLRSRNVSTVLRLLLTQGESGNLKYHPYNQISAGNIFRRAKFSLDICYLSKVLTPIGLKLYACSGASLRYGQSSPLICPRILKCAALWWYVDLPLQWFALEWLLALPTSSFPHFSFTI